MKISVNGKLLLELSEIQKKVICNDIDATTLDNDLKARIAWVLLHKYERCFKRLKEQWEPRLKKAGVASIPLDNDAFAQLVFSQRDYKDRAQRDAEAKKDRDNQ